MNLTRQGFHDTLSSSSMFWTNKKIRLPEPDPQAMTMDEFSTFGVYTSFIIDA